MNNFCVESGLQNPKCYTTETFNFQSEEQIFDVILDVFKSQLPGLLHEVKDCQDKPMVILEQAIDLIPPQEEVKFSLTLNPLKATPHYVDSLVYRTVEHDFEFLLTVSSEVLNCVLWELIRFKNVVESLLIGTQFAIDGFQSVDIEHKGFNYFVITHEKGTYYKEGALRFSVTVTQSKIN